MKISKQKLIQALEKEIWKPVIGYEGLYEVSNMGRVKSAKRGTLNKQKTSSLGYKVIGLYKNGKPRTQVVHRLVLCAFVDNVENKPHVNHIDGNKQNNNVENLEWCTRSENMRHADKTGLRHNAKWEKHHNSKLSWKEVEQIRQLIKEGEQQRPIAKRFGISQCHVSEIASYKRWKPDKAISIVNSMKGEE